MTMPQNLYVSGAARAALDAELVTLPSVDLTPAQVMELELLLSGALAPTDAYMTRAAYEQALAGDDVWPIALDVESSTANPPRAGARVTLCHPEGTPLAVLTVGDVWQSEDGGPVRVGGSLEGLDRSPHPTFARRRFLPAELSGVLGDGRRVGVFLDRPIDSARIAAVQALAAGQAPDVEGAHVVLFALPGADFVLRMRTYEAALAHLPDSVTLVALDVRTDDGARDAERLERVAANHGVSEVLWDLPARTDALIAALRAEDDASSLAPPEVLDILQRAYRPRSEQGFTLFFTGLSGSGKSTVAREVIALLEEDGRRPVTVLDGDIVRKHLSKGLGFSREDRDTNIRRIGFVASEIVRNGGAVVCAAIAPYAATRDAVREMIAPCGRFVLVHVATPLEVCESRDPKGLYAKARAGEITGFTGVDDPYEAPEDAEITLDTGTLSPSEAAVQVLDWLRAERYL